MSRSSKIQRRPPTPRWRGLLLQLFLFIVLPLTALLMAIPLGSLTLHARAMRDLVGERDSRAARAAADSSAEQLHHRAAAIRGLALRAAVSPSPRCAGGRRFLERSDQRLARG